MDTSIIGMMLPESVPVANSPTATITPKPDSATLAERANAGDSAASLKWNVLKAQTIQENKPIELRSLVSLKMRPARRSHFVNVPRSLALVDGWLLDLFGLLVSGKEPWPLYLHGPVGSGKTRAAMALGDCVQHGFEYFTPDDLCTRIMKGQDLFEGLMLEPSIDSQLWILDELGCRQKVGDLHYSAVKAFADWSEFRRENVALYISNLSPTDLAAVYDDRLASRILCGTWFHLQAKDRRLTQ